MSERAAASSRSPWLRNFQKPRSYGVDISEDALALARENAARLDLADRVRFARSNLA